MKKARFVPIFFLLLFLNFRPVVAQVGEVYGFCFPDDVILDKALEYLRPILLPDDNPTYLRRINCFELRLSDPRKNLVETFLRKQYQIRRIYQQTSAATSDQAEDLKEYSTGDVFQQCRIDITETTIIQQDATKVHENPLVAQRDNGFKKEVANRMLLLGEKMPGHLVVDGTEVEINCISSGKNHRTLTLTSRQPEGEVSTSLRVLLGERVDFGRVVRKELLGKSKLALSEGNLNAQTTHQLASTEYQLVVK